MSENESIDYIIIEIRKVVYEMFFIKVLVSVKILMGYFYFLVLFDNLEMDECFRKYLFFMYFVGLYL